MTKLMIGLMMAGALLVGCDKGGEAKGDKGAASASPAAKGGGGDSIGVKECDDYLAKYDACGKKMPAAGKAAWDMGAKTQRDAWKQMAAEPATKATLASTCKQVMDALDKNPQCK